jgi:hypothetical protein
MKKLFCLFLICLTLNACGSSDDPAPVPSVLGFTYVRTSYVFDIPFDGNNDGIFSTDVYDEIQCPAQMTFQSTNVVENPLNSVVYLRVITDFNQQLAQSITCADEGTTPALFDQNGSQIRFTDAGGQLLITGELSADGTELTFTIPRADLIGLDPFGSDNILSENGARVSYGASVAVTYTRQ